MAIVLNDGYLLEGDAGDATQVDYTITGLDGTTLKMLASGQLAAAKATLYTAANVDTIAGITLFNTGAATAVNLYVNDGTSRQVVGIDSLGAGYHALFDGNKLSVYDENGSLQIETTAIAHASSHQNGGSDEISVTGLSGLLADDQHVLDAEVVAVAVAKATFDAHTILAATTDDTPVALEITEQTIPGRLTGGNIKALTVAELITLALSGTIPEDVGMLLDFALSADGKYVPIKQIVGTAGTNLAYGETIYFQAADSKWEKIDANAEASTKPLAGIVIVAGNENAAITVMLEGFIREDDWNWTAPGAPLFASAATAGGLVETAPAGSADCIRIMGHVIDANTIYFHPENAWDELA